MLVCGGLSSLMRSAADETWGESVIAMWLLPSASSPRRQRTSKNRYRKPLNGRITETYRNVKMANCMFISILWSAIFNDVQNGMQLTRCWFCCPLPSAAAAAVARTSYDFDSLSCGMCDDRNITSLIPVSACDTNSRNFFSIQRRWLNDPPLAEPLGIESLELANTARDRFARGKVHRLMEAQRTTFCYSYNI
jgi:hypothetical protein